MLTTVNLKIPYLEQNVAEPDIPENDFKDIVDAAICGQLDINMTVNTDYTLDTSSLSYPQEWHHGILIITPVAHTSITNLILPDTYKMKYTIYNNSGSGFNITFKTASGTGISIPDNAIYNCFSNGTDILRIT